MSYPKAKLAIKTTGEGNYIFIGKMPLFAKKWAKQLGEWVSSDGFVSMETCGRMYAVETRPPELVKEVIELLTSEPKSEPEPEINEKKLTTDLEKLGFKNLSDKGDKPAKKGDKPVKTKKQYVPRGERKTDYCGKPIAQGGLSLYKWLKVQDYVIYKLFIDRFSGRPLVEKFITVEDVKTLLKQENEPKAYQKACLAISQLIRHDKKILIKNEEIDENGKPVLTYHLDLTRGINYARGVVATVKAGEYQWVNGQRQLQSVLSTDN